MTRTAREVVELQQTGGLEHPRLRPGRGVIGGQRLGTRLVRSTCSPTPRRWRVVDTWEMFDEIRFDLHLVVAGDDGEHVAVVYQSPMTLKDGTELSIGSMEIFRVVDGRITEVWNCGYKQGVWR